MVPMLKKRYHVFRNVPEHELSIEQCIERADVLFRQAIKRIYEKSREYGYQAECDLSGGLDSRMAVWVAHNMGYYDVQNICYSVKGSLDHRISEKIAKDLGNKYHFSPMSADIITDIDRKTKLCGGQVLYMLSTGAVKALEEIDATNIGLCCTGLLGEIQNGYWTEGVVHTDPNYISNRKSYYYDLIVDDSLKKRYDNYEQMNLYEYSMKLFLLSSLFRQQLCEVSSPFIDVDYLEFAYKIPLKYRKDYRFVMQWMCTKYPEAAEYEWQTMRMPVDRYFYKKKYLKKYVYDAESFIKRGINKVFRELGIPFGVIKSDDMNPFDVWYKTDKKTREYLDAYFSKTINKVDSNELRSKLADMYNHTKIPTDKMQVISVLSVYKNFCR